MMNITHHPKGSPAVLWESLAHKCWLYQQCGTDTARGVWHWQRLVAVAAPVVALFLTLGEPAYAGRPYYYIYAHNSNLVLAPLNDSKREDEEIVLSTPGNRGAQHWFIDYREDIGGGQSVRRFRNRHSHLCIYISDYEYGTKLVQKPCEQPYDPRSTEWIVSNKDDMWAGRPRLFTIWSNKTGKCMDVPGGQYANYVRLIQWDCHGGSNQEFDTEYRGTSG